VLTAQFTIQEIKSLFRRRKFYFFIPIVVITCLSIVGSLLLKNKYESSTTILVQRDQIVNPLLGYEIAAAMASEDRLRMFNEILFSRSNIQKLIDSLGIADNITGEGDRQALVSAISRNISNERRGTDAYMLTYTDTDPVRVQRAVSLLSKIFIDNLISIEAKKSEQAVQFFENKLEEARIKYETSQGQVVSLIGSKLGSLPPENRTQYSQIGEIDGQVANIDTRLKLYQEHLGVLKSSSSSLRTEKNKEVLYNLARTDIPFAEDLRILLNKYDDRLRRYTAQYPEVQIMEQQVPELLIRMRTGLESEIDRLQSQHLELARRRMVLVDEIKSSSISERMNENVESDYSMYRKLYDDMKVKLEQARTTRDLGMKAGNQFIILDPPIIPSKPSKPNRTQIVIIGFVLGIFAGFLAVVVRELLDTTIRSRRDIEVYRKPVIAYIIDGSDNWENK
jgi:uncharacterized protein involved in exopolysaccharide biosynthesis